MTNKSTSKLVMGFAMFALIALALSGCGGGGNSSTSIPATPVTPPAKMSEALTLPTAHGLAVGEFTLQPGASDEYGNVVVSCPAGGAACVVTVSADGTATYDRTGGVPTVMAAYDPWNLPTGHGLAVGEFTLQPGASDEYGNVVVSCPAGGGACVVTVSADGTATYDRTGGVPSVIAASASRLPFPFRGSNEIDFRTSINGQPLQTPADALNMPIFSVSTSHEHYDYERPARVFVGVEQFLGPDAPFIKGATEDILPIVGTRGDFDIRYGRVQDGPGANEVGAYLHDALALSGNVAAGQDRFIEPPIV